jgi:hypothetical protein
MTVTEEQLRAETAARFAALRVRLASLPYSTEPMRTGTLATLDQLEETVSKLPLQMTPVESPQPKYANDGEARNYIALGGPEHELVRDEFAKTGTDVIADPNRGATGHS